MKRKSSVGATARVQRLRQFNPGAYLNNPNRRPACNHCQQYRNGYDAGYLAGRRDERNRG